MQLHCGICWDDSGPVGTAVVRAACGGAAVVRAPAGAIVVTASGGGVVPAGTCAAVAAKSSRVLSP